MSDVSIIYHVTVLALALRVPPIHRLAHAFADSIVDCRLGVVVLRVAIGGGKRTSALQAWDIGFSS